MWNEEHLECKYCTCVFGDKLYNCKIYHPLTFLWMGGRMFCMYTGVFEPSVIRQSP